MFPASISYDEILRFRRLLDGRGQDAIQWNAWKHTYRRSKFQALTKAFNFLGFSSPINVLTPLGRRFVFGGHDQAIVVGLVQSDYFPLFQEILKVEKTETSVLRALSMLCASPTPMRERRLMYKAFIDLSTRVGLLEAQCEKVALTTRGKEAVKKHSRVPLWVPDLPLFAECKRIERFKALYYATGHPFRNIVKEAFAELGFEAENLPKEVSGIPDIEVAASGFEAVIETKGEKKQIGENDVNQVAKAQSRPKFKDKKLVFVGNAFRLRPPDQRGEFFHRDAITLAESRGITLLTSFSLLNALRTKWKEKTLDIQLVARNLSKRGLCSVLV